MHWYMSWVGIEPGLGMLGIDCMKHKISMAVFVAFFFCSTSIVGLGYVAGRGGEGGAGGGGVKVRGKHS